MKTVLQFSAMIIAASLIGGVVLAAPKTRSSTCSAYDSDENVTQYSVQLAAAESGDFELEIQVFHPEIAASRIETIELSTGDAPEIEFLGEDCICGMEINGVDAGCAHIARYLAPLSRGILVAAKGAGLGMTFRLANGKVVDGPHIAASEVKRVLG